MNELQVMGVIVPMTSTASSPWLVWLDTTLWPPMTRPLWCSTLPRLDLWPLPWMPQVGEVTRVESLMVAALTRISPSTTESNWLDTALNTDQRKNVFLNTNIFSTKYFSVEPSPTGWFATPGVPTGARTGSSVWREPPSVGSTPRPWTGPPVWVGLAMTSRQCVGCVACYWTQPSLLASTNGKCNLTNNINVAQ